MPTADIGRQVAHSVELGAMKIDGKRPFLPNVDVDGWGRKNKSIPYCECADAKETTTR